MANLEVFNVKSLFCCLLGMCWWSSVSSASEVLIYHNNFTGSVSPTVGATPAAGVLATSWIFGEASVDPSWVGQPIQGAVVDVSNPTANSIYAGLFLGMWAANGVGGGPGTLLAPVGYSDSIELTPGNHGIELTGAGGSGLGALYPIPAGKFWMGYALENKNSSTTAAELDALRFLTGDAPDIGTSSAFALLGSQVGTLGNNPSIASALNTYLTQRIIMFVPDPPSDVPEPSSGQLAGLGILLAAAIRYLRTARLA
jgi:hypothetical protein